VLPYDRRQKAEAVARYLRKREVRVARLLAGAVPRPRLYEARSIYALTRKRNPGGTFARKDAVTNMPAAANGDSGEDREDGGTDGGGTEGGGDIADGDVSPAIAIVATAHSSDDGNGVDNDAQASDRAADGDVPTLTAILQAHLGSTRLLSPPPPIASSTLRLPLAADSTTSSGVPRADAVPSPALSPASRFAETIAAAAATDVAPTIGEPRDTPFAPLPFATDADLSLVALGAATSPLARFRVPVA
jgi:hypothetical protein